MNSHSQPLLEQHLRVRVSPVVREDGSGSNTYNIEAISSSDSDSSDSDDAMSPSNSQPEESFNLDSTNGDDNQVFSDIEALSDDDSSSDATLHTATLGDFLLDRSPSPSPPRAVDSSSDYSHDEQGVGLYSDSTNEDSTDDIQLNDPDVI